ncbi:hypothetical protein AOL_s00078g10 [Orbilia oligospora ATCC 24927]|uniref:Uncharacterized protein n=2 Tax=Orbilia oligospora TaxID=2813651 RepID=G1XAR3_ARTOA|nr:hypothetical protein AOL_s00078g10 [Orbilia oligospora ATCC 24927]EGX49521.1 hypothetical protein AOL_s00078g10 [Orbilia oligospora ATCC 24927]KAF3278738.1 hypothetical protein TWF970_004293 [Orbilia oligospora]
MASKRPPAMSIYRACLRELPPILFRIPRLSETREATAGAITAARAPAALHTRRLALHNCLRRAIQRNSLGELSQMQMGVAGILRTQQMIRYLEAQRSYIELLERYNAGLLGGNQDRIRRAARRVGLEIAG